VTAGSSVTRSERSEHADSICVIWPMHIHSPLPAFHNTIDASMFKYHRALHLKSLAVPVSNKAPYYQ
jgi:hypothetical protein